ncbi:cobalt-zinc-cadmium efflux system protein [Streptomyces sp. SAI-208]|uniref:cation diffusion facilitator family transporter n=1 Tax=unclassified Streptomyces TaxID=2593676 RepID=UPI002473BE87|nr:MULTISPECIES: cation diffusion facilitator family transporter [unclassified Streptomyces]MDH6515205.1 cobalt-zinc-cadmium efflux system protein [Streptomyces sp. SAI-090]MDH6547420.1 cobalt-zinc-cadmium efflux system protein [Streptomyces sp. SAI-041]MDH6566502.1 cobalt-zinc-cadmium efflux system protein [Streptomyces sp. SAI-117]MDH6588559.1 cobalt-zinc-cadmium efflux system protein [Streptomyces sp. SAI-133]MDH6606049.1 cobalt-zinc-cadmium efflux system protein [Streptomyces sp. SAI-208]
MGAGHDHGHAHAPAGGTATAAYVGRLRVALSITLTVMVVEIVGGVVADSLALVADAAHMATDALGLGMALLAIHFANRPPTGNRTFGYARAEILAALANCLLLLGVGGYVLYEAIQRFVTPADTEGGLTIVFGAVGLVANMISLTLLMRGQKESLNVRGAFLEVAADALGSFAVIVSAAVILTTGWQAADPIASLVIGLMIVPRTFRLLRETLDVLLESAPKDVDMTEVRTHILALDGVEDVHDLHAWTITSGMPVLSAHVVVSTEVLSAIGHEKMLHELQNCLGDHFDVEHCTFQLEPGGHAEHEAHLCH